VTAPDAALRLNGSARELVEETDAIATPTDAVLRLVGGLRAAGAPVSTSEAMDALRALPAVDVLRRPTVRRTLRCALVKDSAYGPAFERAFDAVFARPRTPAPSPGSAPLGDDPAGTGDGPGRDADDPGRIADELSAILRSDDAARLEQLARGSVQRWAGIAEYDGSAGHHTQRLLHTLSLDRVLRGMLAAGPPTATAADRTLRIAEARERVEELRALLARIVAEDIAARRGSWPDPVAGPAPYDPDRSILLASPDELDALRSAVRPLARRSAARMRRHRPGGTTLDMRRTIRRSMSTGGVPLDPCARRMTPRRPELRVLCDVSGSMAGYARFALALVHALQDEFPRTRAWVFVDGIVEVTDVLRGCPADGMGRLDPHQLLGRRGLVGRDGRSDYAAAMGTFLDRWPDALTARSTVLVLGDGRSHDREPAVQQLAGIARAARRMYWLNPEPRAEWDTDDSRMSRYRPHCAGVFEVATLRRLEHCVSEIGR
jgi:hypothetical protein